MAGELLPEGALDDEPPDEQRVMEATGNEGASFERSYHRAALIFWDGCRTTEVLLQAGTAAAVAHLEHALAHAEMNVASQQNQVLAAAQAVTLNWNQTADASWRRPQRGTGLKGMLNVLSQLKHVPTVESFVETVVVESFERGINEELVCCLMLLEERRRRVVSITLIQANTEKFPADCIDCRALMRFARDPSEKAHRFPLRQDRRQHLHQRMDGDDMDMTHETERRGRPYTLVCTKTRRSYERRLTQYAEDIESMTFLLQQAPAETDVETRRLNAAIALAPVH